MKIIQGKQIKAYKEALEFAFYEGLVSDMKPSVADLFNSMIDTSKLQPEVEKNISAAIHGKYGKKTFWHGEEWHVPIPGLGYDTRGAPYLTINLRIYLVASGEVETDTRSYRAVLIGLLGKPETLVIPLVLLQALLDDDLSRFAVLAKSAGRTTWEIPNSKPVTLPDIFVSQLTAVLKNQSVVDWLHSFGVQGRGIAVLVAGSLLGMQFASTVQPDTPLGQRVWTNEQLVAILEGMAYSKKEARDMINQTSPHLKPDTVLEEAVRAVLQTAGKGV